MYVSGNYPFYISTFLSAALNYFGQKFIVFKKMNLSIIIPCYNEGIINKKISQ